MGKPVDDGVLDPGSAPGCPVPVFGKEVPVLPLEPVDGIEGPGRPGIPFDLDDETVTPGWLEPGLAPELGPPLVLGMPELGLLELGLLELEEGLFEEGKLLD